MNTLIKRLLLWGKDNWIFFMTLSTLVFLLFLGKCNNDKIADKLQLSQVELSTLKDTVKVFKDKNKNLTFSLSSVVVESDNRRKALEAAGFEIKDLKARDIKWRDITDALKLQISAESHGSTPLKDTVYISNTDTIKAAEFDWNNKFLFLKGNIIDKNLSFAYKYKTGIDIVSTKKGKSYVVSAYLSDPNAVVITANSITIDNKIRWYEKPWVWMVVGVGAGFYLGTR